MLVGHSETYFQEVIEISKNIDCNMLDKIASELSDLRQRDGRLFILGVGGSAANSSHAVNDFRKLCEIEAYSPVDNCSELTARTNDEGWKTIFSGWLQVSKLSSNDAILILSVGGGDAERNISPNLIEAIDLAKGRGALIFGVVGRNQGYTKQNGDYVLVVPEVEKSRVTPHSETFQAAVWHCLVSNPLLQIKSTKW
jgi:D-sedoheptulose 7-phosphate isomerase